MLNRLQKHFQSTKDISLRDLCIMTNQFYHIRVFYLFSHLTPVIIMVIIEHLSKEFIQFSHRIQNVQSINSFCINLLGSFIYVRFNIFFKYIFAMNICTTKDLLLLKDSYSPTCTNHDQTIPN